MVNHDIFHVFMPCIMSLILCSTSTVHYFDTVTLTLQAHNVNEYNCTVTRSQMQRSLYLTEQCAEFDQDSGKIVFDSDTLFPKQGILAGGILICPLPYDPDKHFLKSGFNDMCNYLHNDNFNRVYDNHTYQLPMPLLLNTSNDFYDDVTQLTNQEILFMKQLESFDESLNNDNDNPFDIDMTRMNSLFKVSEFLQMERLLTIVAARQASLMTNMDKNKMIQWLLDTPNTQKPTMKINNNNQCKDEKLVPLLPQKQSCTNRDNAILHINEINKYNWALLTRILPFFSCYDIHTFSSISNEFYHFVNEWMNTNPNIDPLIQVLTNNANATCLSLTNQEVLFYTPFLTLPKHKWSENQNNTYIQLKTVSDTMIHVDSNNQFQFHTIISFSDGGYSLYTFKCTINDDDHSIEIDNNVEYQQKRVAGISYKFGKFAQQLNILSQLMNVEHIKIYISSFDDLESFDNLVGINYINNVKTITIDQHSFPFIDFAQIYNVNSQIEYLEIDAKYENRNKTRSVQHMEFLSKMKSLKGLLLGNNRLDSFDFDALTGLTNLQEVKVYGNKLNFKKDTPCLDFSFLVNLPDLTELHVGNNQIVCINNFIAIQKHSNLLSLDLAQNKISSLELNLFQGTNLRYIDLSHNQLSSFNDNNDTSQLQQCLDFNSFDRMPQLQWLQLDFNQIQCVVNFESIQQHRQLNSLHLNDNHFLSLIDFTKFDESKPLMNSLNTIYLNNMNLKYTMQNNNCLNLQFLKFMPHVEALAFSDNKIECIDNISILQQVNLNVQYVYLDNNNLLSFDFVDLIGSNIRQIYLTNNRLSFESLKNFDEHTLSQINPSGEVMIGITHGNSVKLPSITSEGISIY